ncbi:hypothetical protein GUITHDRAFT_103362 [Guillardia theta CCMP2712]|uniref:Sugar phosphate transporter domain-containing protein n=2 Tax=Guillardia theta TaxID=55529 RepID=L1JQS1_GUITC|nr:hypothetical protein GUITHDRAFT_103362 [Guillardia theta CCMP2712]EKX50772.1 hypothetical protein GUITHDRAFT_103362 [Guillardia theta CCMP2712]|mmetsp:Transcript_29302/g.94111  ORF Transcript_29302/g.94111 Transcript_29302/m.94111 type:complete len:341 (+) Transcript_29302:168-1190(+)|eukprot:XP_005837752.1 hypothetical protein GUITHDRAFT_103362 [Guillardia theta CCMP2712]
MNAITIIALYSICSSCMLVVNRICLSYIPAASYIACFQMAFTVLVILIGASMGLCEVQALSSDGRSYMAAYSVGFALSIYFTLRALETTNMETLIVFRSCNPLILVLCDYYFLNRDCPSVRAIFALMIIAGSASMYIVHDKQLKMDGWISYLYVGLNSLTLIFVMTIGKTVTDKCTLTTTGQVFYSNMFSVLPMLCLGWLTEEQVESKMIHTKSMVFLLISSIVGSSISYFGWRCRELVSATTYTVVGIMNKVFTEGLNCLFLNSTASQEGIFWLFVCILGGLFYEQAPKKATAEAEDPNGEAGEVKEALLQEEKEVSVEMQSMKEETKEETKQDSKENS